jgi:peptide/nickel transport system ATP-binding protein
MSASNAPRAAGSATEQRVEEPLLEVRDLRVTIETARGHVVAVDDLTLSVGRGEVVGVVGESGSGKSLACLAMMGLVAPPVAIAGGSIRFDGRELRELRERELRSLRGDEISMVFQEPLTSLDGAFTIGHQLVETVRAHRPASRREAERLGQAMLERVGIPAARQRMSAYPHELSGGMRQRVMIALALVLEPKLLLADEPVTALDVTTQAQIVELMLELQREMGMSIVFISHDLGVVLDVADRIAVMYAGQLLEQADAQSLFAHPRHPYSQGLLMSKLSLFDRDRPVTVMPGQIPALTDRAAVCRFAPRCSNRLPICVEQMPPLAQLGSDRLLRCFNPVDEETA